MTVNSARTGSAQERAAVIVIGLAGVFLFVSCTSAPTSTAAMTDVEPASAVSDMKQDASSAPHELAPRTTVATTRGRADVQEPDTGDQQDETPTTQDSYSKGPRTAQDLQREIDDLQAAVTDRGLVMTLGDVLFASAATELSIGSDERIAKLADFLNKYPGCSALIDGYTDNVGNDGYNRGLSQRRADAVRTALINRGVGSARLIAIGRGETSPVSDNNSTAGREQNRRVQVLIENTLVTSRESCM